MPEQASKRAGRAKLALVVVAIVALVVAGRMLPLGEWLGDVLDFVRALGPLGYVVFVLVYVLATVLFLPGSVLTLGAGAVFGLAGGFIAVSLGSTLGAAAAFLVGRFAAREAIARKLEGNARFAAIDRAVGREGFKIVLPTRLSPVFPFNLLNYAHGLTTVKFWHYVLASWLGMMPGTFLYVFVGSAAGDAAQGGAGGWGLALKGIGLLATIAVTLVITRTARAALAQATELPVQ